jgi:hypothetical protein
VEVGLRGGSFVSGAAIGFGDEPAAVTSVSASEIHVLSPTSSTTGPVNIVASSPDGWTTVAPLAFSYGPEVLYFTPMGDSIAGGSQITIFGYGFGSDASRIFVRIGGRSAQVIGSSLYGQDYTYPSIF